MDHYKFLEIQSMGNYTIVTLNRKKSNPINLTVLQELDQCFDILTQDAKTNGVILTGQENYFSVGVDVIEVFNYNRDESAQFWTLLMHVMIKLFKFPKPFIAAIIGYAPAGGCILAIPADYRIMASGPFTIGLNEIPLGLAVPEPFFQIYSFWLGQHKAYQYLLDGKLLNTEEALNAGLIDEIVAPENVLAKAEEKMKQYLKIIPSVFRISKVNFRKSLIERFDKNSNDSMELFIEQWWSPETRKTIKQFVDQLQNKKLNNPEY